ncbi:MAG: glutamine synthetase family protein [Candidatus Thermoplasmatota archaeon]|nr:glutamine synthetase family protein [Candidatus Thermoplasmatota archaeon]
MDSSELAEVVKKNDIQWIQVHFTDLIGRLRVLYVQVNQFLEGYWEQGIGFDGSSVGLARVERSDLLAMPDLSTFMVLPHEEDEARVIANIYGSDGKPFPADPRRILQRAVGSIHDAGFERALFSPEMEFYVIDSSDEPEVETIERQGYCAPSSNDRVKPYRKQLSELLMGSGFQVKYHHHEKGRQQHEIEVQGMEVLGAADYCVFFKYLAQEVARWYDLVVTFMPKPFSDDAGSGMHAHVLFEKHGENAFFDPDDSYHLSQTARYFIGGVLEHARGMAAIANPTLNSYKRLIPHFEAPVFISWARYNRSSLIRIPARKQVDVEIRNADPAANPYLLFAAMLHAGLDGIKHKITYEPVEKNFYEFEGAAGGVKKLPTDLKTALEELQNDEVISKALGSEAISLFVAKKQREWQQYIVETTDLEYKLYFNC